MRRRDFVRRLALAGATAMVATPRLVAQSAGAEQATGPEQSSGSSNLFDMKQDAAKSVRRPPKAGARASMSADERDALEHDIRCQCGCTLDVYTCRTTDFSCQVSPAMHRDVISLVEGGYSAREILDAFVDTYGERALMAPTKQGFNLAGYVVPFAAIGVGFVTLVAVLRRMQRRTIPVATPDIAPARPVGTDEELARLQAAISRDD